jgi:hypothetical protein
VAAVTEADRKARNLARLGECHPAFRARLLPVLEALVGEGYRPRIQHAWRSVAEQEALRASGASKLKWGYHNCTAPDGTPESLAADVLDDDNPMDSRPIYLLRLSYHAWQAGLGTGLDWGLPNVLRRSLRALVASGAEPPADFKRGWDPTHLEITGISVPNAKIGERPT